MVSSKKSSRKTKRTPKKVEKPVVDDAIFNETSVTSGGLDLGTLEATRGTEVSVETSPEPVILQSSEETAWALLDAAPEMPHITSVEDAVKFADEYNRWKRDVKGTKRG